VLVQYQDRDDITWCPLDRGDGLGSALLDYAVAKITSSWREEDHEEVLADLGHRERVLDEWFDALPVEAA
jgi:hypothetical protein